MKKPVVLGITLGDVGGIGPEIVLKAVHGVAWPRRLRFVIIGCPSILSEEARKLGLPGLEEWTPGRTPPPARAAVWQPAPVFRLKNRPGSVRVGASRAAAAWIRAGVDGCMDGFLDGMVTAPISKEGFYRAGINVPGHTELIAKLTHTRQYAMMLIGGLMRVVPVTRHIPLSKVPKSLTTAEIVSAGELAAASLPWLGVRETTVGVCGLNPHAGDGGAIGHEEADVIIPAIRALRRKGLDVEGPVAADTAFYKAARGEYGAVLAMYHDQGLGPLKTIAFESGVNLTLGLPIVRTSPDHGTAFDIAGRGVADPLSMVNAVRLAYRLATGRNPWKITQTHVQ